MESKEKETLISVYNLHQELKTNYYEAIENLFDALNILTSFSPSYYPDEVYYLFCDIFMDQIRFWGTLKEYQKDEYVNKIFKVNEDLLKEIERIRKK